MRMALSHWEVTILVLIISQLSMTSCILLAALANIDTAQHLDYTSVSRHASQTLTLGLLSRLPCELSLGSEATSQTDRFHLWHKLCGGSKAVVCVRVVEVILQVLQRALHRSRMALGTLDSMESREGCRLCFSMCIS